MSIKSILMRRDGVSAQEAGQQIKEAKEELALRLEGKGDGDPQDICEDMFGLEPDYLMELI